MLLRKSALYTTLFQLDLQQNLANKNQLVVSSRVDSLSEHHDSIESELQQMGRKTQEIEDTKMDEV